MDEQKINLAKYRLEKAGEELESARLSFNNNLPRASLSNSYYSVFHSMRILFALEGIDSKTHKGAAHLFNLHFVKTGLLSEKMNDILSGAFEMRLDSDYEDFYVASKEEAKEQIDNAEFFLNEVLRFIKQHYNIEL